MREEKTSCVWRAAKRAAALLLAVLAATATASGQQVTMLEIRKESGGNNRTTVEIRVPMELQGFDFDNPVDADQSALAVFADDQGRDLLQIHRDRQSKLRDQGYSTQPAMSFGGVADYAANKDIKLRVEVGAVAAENATSLRLKGSAVLNFAGQGEPRALEIVNVPVEMPYDSEGFASEIGPIIVVSDGSAELDGVTYRKFTVRGTENSIVAARPVGGDDSAEVDFWAVADNQFVFKEVPKTVALEIRYSAVRKVPVEFDLAFSVGL